MEAQDFHSLQEAYMEVYSVDEGLGSAIKKLFGGKKKEAEAPKPPMSRGEYLRQRYNVGPERSDTSAKRQILDRSGARAKRDQERYGDKPFQKQVAQQSQAAHDRYLRAGYSKYHANDPRGSGNRARRRAAALQKEEFDNFDIILSHLLDEGYAETLKSAEVIMVNMSEDWRESICEEYKKLPVGRMMRQAIRKGKKLSGYENTSDKSQKVYLKHLQAKELRGQDVEYPTVGEYQNKLKGQIDKMITIGDTHDTEKVKAKSKFKK